MHQWNCRQKQRDVLAKVLNLNSPQVPGRDQADSYKVLILDRYSKDIVAPLLRVNDLRKHGVTLHLMVEAERQPITDVPAVYLVQPTAANVERIVADAAGSLYESMHVNFTTSLPSKLLEQLAMGMVKVDAASKLSKLYDQYLAFIALESNLFSLGLSDAYVRLNDPAAQDTQIEAIVGVIVDGLFSLCVTMGVMPVIRCPKGGVAEHVAAMLDNKLRDALRVRNGLFADGGAGVPVSATRPLLCLFDRNFDLTSTLQHVWTYQPMVHDVLNLSLNRVLLPAEKPTGIVGKPAAPSSLDVDDHDVFWERCWDHPFQQIAEEAETQRKQCEAAIDSITKQKSAMSEGEHVTEEELIRRNTQHLMSAVSSVPELLEQKKTAYKHWRMAHALLDSIKLRGLDTWQSTDEEILSGKADLAAVVKMVSGPRGTSADRLRTAIIWLLAVPGVPSDSEYNELDTALRTAGCDTTSLAYVRTLKRNNLVGTRGGLEGAQAAQAAGGASGGSAALLNYVASKVTGAVQTLLSVGRQAPLTIALENLMDGKAGTPEYDTYAVFDPKAPPGRTGLERAKGPFKEGIVFMIGGGSYSERETVITWATKGSGGAAQGAGVLGSGGSAPVVRHVLYGATDMLTGEQTVKQLAELGRLSSLGPGGIDIAGPAGPAAANGSK